MSGLSDITATTGGRAELCCKLSAENTEGKWYKNEKPVSNIFHQYSGKLLNTFLQLLVSIETNLFLPDQLTNEDGVRIIKDGAYHKLIIDCCEKGDAAVYCFESDGRKSEATLNIQGKN